MMLKMNPSVPPVWGGTRFGPHGVLRFVRIKAILNNQVGPLDLNFEVVPLR